ncbi:hypothetical protein B4N89_25230 [Embleya scabrispora]|uniref:Uncharacterized protein n=1 Tax=Embleya scabrispora TaxID=159449 RepID=A0A1T3P4B9_9ACTN|nr:hypothetical protein [Embleya scabrispora]OPC83801.1 hypothetical protein B4N89_25230 [Embleya scabrispora]
MSAAKGLGVLLFVGTTVLGIVLYFVEDTSLADLLSLGAGALCLFWLIMVLTVPWNLYFRARQLITEIAISRERGLAVPEGRDVEARRIARRLLVGAIGAHMLSAGVIALITWISGGVVGYWFAGFYLLSTLFRPGGAYAEHLAQRLRTMLREVTHPREDVLALIERVRVLETRVEALETRTEDLRVSVTQLRETAVSETAHTTTRFHEADRKVDALGRRFEDTISQLTDNQEVISGIKAFLRLLRTEQS